MLRAQIDWTRPPALADLLRAEEELERAAALLAAVLPPHAELHGLAADHARARELLEPFLDGSPTAVTAARAFAGALLRAVLGGEESTLRWLAEREHQLVEGYLALERAVVSPLEVPLRARLQRDLLPLAFDRFTRIDRLLVAFEEPDAPDAA